MCKSFNCSGTFCVANSPGFDLWQYKRIEGGRCCCSTHKFSPLKRAALKKVALLFIIYFFPADTYAVNVVKNKLNILFICRLVLHLE